MIAAGAFEPFYVRIFAIHRAQFRAGLIELPYRKLPGLRELLVATRERTRDGDVVAVVAPYPWEQGSEYVYARSLYTLSGRKVERFVGNAEWICAYGAVPPVPDFAVVWRGRDGVLMRRRR